MKNVRPSFPHKSEKTTTSPPHPKNPHPTKVKNPKVSAAPNGAPCRPSKSYDTLDALPHDAGSPGLRQSLRDGWGGVRLWLRANP